MDILHDPQTRMLAKAVESAVFQCLLNAQANPDDEDKWFKQATKMEQKFKTDFGVHYTYITQPDLKIYYT